MRFLLSILLGLTINLADGAAPAQVATPEAQDATSTGFTTVTVQKGAITLQIPSNWSVFEDAQVGPLGTDTVKVGYLAMLEGDPKVRLTENYLKAYLVEHTATTQIEQLPGGRYLAYAPQAPDSTERRWRMAKVLSARHYAVGIFSYFASTPNERMEKQVLQVIKSAQFNPLPPPAVAPRAPRSCAAAQAG